MSQKYLGTLVALVATVLVLGGIDSVLAEPAQKMDKSTHNMKDKKAVSGDYDRTDKSAHEAAKDKKTTSDYTKTDKSAHDVTKEKRLVSEPMRYTATERGILYQMDRNSAVTASQMIQTLQEYRQTLQRYDVEDKANEKRLTAQASSLDSKLGSIVDHLLQRPQTVIEMTKPSVEVVNVHMLRNGSPGDSDVARIIYKVTAGDMPLRDAKVVVDTQADMMETRINNLFASHSSLHTVHMNVKDPSTISVKLVR